MTTLINFIVGRALAADPSEVKLDLSEITNVLDPSGGAGLQASLTSLIFTFLGAAAFAGVLYSGFMMITAGGDATKFAAGRKNLLWSIIGIVIVVLSYYIIHFIYNLVGNVV